MVMYFGISFLFIFKSVATFFRVGHPRRSSLHVIESDEGSVVVSAQQASEPSASSAFANGAGVCTVLSWDDIETLAAKQGRKTF